MGWAKYAEDNYEMIQERWDRMDGQKSIVAVTAVIPSMVCAVKVSMEISEEPKKASMKDKSLYCIECGEQFTFTAGEQKYYKRHELDQPKRCKCCREIRKARKAVAI